MRTRIGKYNGICIDSCTHEVILDKVTKDPTFYVDIKSAELRDILRDVLKDVYGLSLMEDKPSVCPSLYQIGLTDR